MDQTVGRAAFAAEIGPLQIMTKVSRSLMCPLLDIVDRTPMATRSVIADDKTAAGIDRASASRVLRYQLNVLAASAQDVVQWAGGWLCDRAKAGWDVNVILADGGDPRPLTILGATALDLNEG